MTALTDRPSTILCPSECQFLRFSPDHLCQFMCVPADSCGALDPTARFANPVTFRCEGCRVIACDECKTDTSCAKCQEGFVLDSTNRCVSRHMIYWYISYAVMGFIVCIFLWYLVMLAMRPTSNPKALEKGLSFRESSKLHDPITGLRYSLWKNLSRENIAGVGVILHFNWMKWSIVWAGVVGLALFILSCFFSTRPSAMKVDPSSHRAFAACDFDVVHQRKEFSLMEMWYTIALICIYLFSTVGSLAFAVHQRRFHNVTNEKSITMDDYALLVSGLPIMYGIDNCEEEITEFFRQAFPDMGIIGASCCWDLRDSETQAFIESENTRIINHMCRVHDFRRGDAVRSQIFARSQTTKEVETKRIIDPQLRWLDSLFGVENKPIDPPRRAEATEEVVKAKLRALDTTECAFIVFNTERECANAYEQAKTQALLFRGRYKLELHIDEMEPDTVLWNGFGTPDYVIALRMCVAGVVVFAAILVLDVCFYAPYVVYITTYSNVKGMVGGGFLEGTLLGLLITVCNQVIYFIIGVVADCMGFSTKGEYQRYYVIQYTAAVFVNTVIDLWTVMLLVQGYSVTDRMKDPLGGDDILSMKALAENPAAQRTVYTQLLCYLYPGCLLLPFLLEPLCVSFLTYWLPLWLVRSREEINAEQAEKRLACPLFDLSRYGDILINVMLCILPLAFTYRDIYQVYVYLFISGLWIYGWDHVRFLRCSQRSIFASSLMDRCAQWITMAPCAMLAALIVFHFWAATDDGFLEPLHDAVEERVHAYFAHDSVLTGIALLRRGTILAHMAAAFLMHMFIHSLILRYIVPMFSESHEEHDVDVPYAETAKKLPCTWFNANPVHCLRSQILFEDDPPCTLFQPGKEYLMNPNPKVGQYFEHKHVDAPAPLSSEGSMSSLRLALPLSRFFSSV
eukprot:TRINITY_DN61036_c0_g1_i1.p1 TRINITY_DN61036_c0_g1~~TRINITY_DN61036_c0_g1_i1.p1  ORF type:complete len:1046 (-),score=102.82 TRINITY_DN61036_c0_g1_i1:60-2789(-)